MKLDTLSRSLLTVVAACNGCASRPDVPAAAPTTFTILHTNDMHGSLSEFLVDTGDATSQTGDRGRSYQEYPRLGVIGGFARIAAAVSGIRQRRGAGNVLLVDAGDTFGDGLLANLTRGAATLRLMDALGYDFMALGNHDYEYTADRTRALQAMVRFPMRGANVRERATGEPFLGDPTRLMTVGGVRVGLLALTYHNTDQTGNKDNARELAFSSGVEAARRFVPELRRRAEVVVVVSHQGTVVDSILAARVAGIDIIVGGHSHDRLRPPRRIGGTWIVQALSDASALGELTVTVRDGHVAAVEGVVHELYADLFAPDARFTRLLDSLRAPYRDTLGAVIATAAERIGRQYKSESPVDKLAAEVLREHAGAEAAFLPGLGFGVTLQPGAITREMLVGLFPHPTSVVRETMTGAQIVSVLEQSATNLRPLDDFDRVGGLVQTAGVRCTIDLRRPAGSRVSDISVGGTPLDRERRYRVATNGGLLQGTHRYAAFAAGQEIVRETTSFIALLEGALRERRSVRAPAMGDVTILR
ncbi:MAG: bifunctional UDP-sugar hydrolase/5'-nucleotidase [Gemmatimonadaceae bacterium]